MSSRLTAALIFLLNFWIAGKLFTIEWLDQMASIEGAYIALARYIAGHWRELDWLPLWYGGIPFQNSYPPLLHLLDAAAVTWLGLTPARAYHAVTALFFCLGPVALFALALRISGSRAGACTAALLYTAVSPSVWLMPDVRADLGGWFGSRRLQVLVGWGEGPHVTAVALLPLALLAIHAAAEKQRPAWIAPAALAAAAVALTNWLGAFALALGVLSWLAAGFELDWRRLRRLALAGVLAYGLAAPWMPPSTVAVIQENAQTIEGDYRGVYALLPLRLGIGLAALALAKFAMRRWRTPAGLQMAVLFSLATGAITLASAWFGIAVLPQPQRYHVPMELGIALALGLAAGLALDRLPPRARWFALGAIFVAAMIPIREARRLARDFLIRPVAIEQTAVYRIAAALAGEERVMAQGAASFWLNAFHDTPQLAGGFDQGVTNPACRVASYVITSDDGAGGRAAEISLLWLKALGVHKVSVGGEKSGEHYKPFRNPRKFAGVLDEIWREGDDWAYRIPQRSRSLARVIRPEDAVARRPVHGLDVEPLRAYVRALDDAALPVAEFTWRGAAAARITASLEPEHALSLQMTHHPGWRATVNGAPCPIRQDGIGQMLLEPRCAGACEVELAYDGGREMRLARGAQGLALAALALLIAGRPRAILKQL
jgi:hypothetical protein